MDSARAICFLFAFTVSCAPAAHAVCGAKTGPGYRGPDGKCVGWVNMGRVCGSPPSLRCTAENVKPDADRGAKKGADIQRFLQNEREK